MRSTVWAGLWILCLLALVACGGGSSGDPTGNGGVVPGGQGTPMVSGVAAS